MANPIKWTKSLLEFPTTDKDSSTTLTNTCYNSQIAPTSFNSQIAAPFSFKAPGEGTFETTDTFTLSNQKYSILNTRFNFIPDSIPAHTARYKKHQRTDLSPVTTEHYVLTVGNQNIGGNLGVWYSLHNPVDNTEVDVGEIISFGSDASLGKSNAIVSDIEQDNTSKFYFYVNYKVIGDYRSRVYSLLKTDGTLSVSPIEFYNVETYPESFINCIRITEDGKKMYVVGYAVAGGSNKAFVGKIDVATFTIDYATSIAFGADEYELTTFDIDENNSPDSVNDNYNLFCSLKVSIAGVNEPDYAMVGVIDTGSSFTASIISVVDTSHVNTYSRTMKVISDKAYSSDLNEGFNEQSEMFRHSLRFAGIKAGTSSPAVFDHATIGKTSNIYSYYARIDINLQSLSSVTGKDLISHSTNLVFRIDGGGTFSMINSSGTVFTATGFGGASPNSLTKYKVEVYRVLESGTWTWKLFANDSEISIIQGAQYADDITIDSSEQVSLGNGFVTATPLVIYYCQISLEGTNIFQANFDDYNDPTKTVIGTYSSGTLVGGYGAYEEEDSLDLGGYFYDNTYLKLGYTTLGQFVFFGVSFSGDYCATLRADTSLTINATKRGYYDNLETTGHALYTGDTFYQTGLSLFSEERMFFCYSPQSSVTETITCFSNNIDADFTDNTDTMTVKFSPTAVNYYSDDIDITENEDFTCTGLCVEGETLTNPYGLIKMNVGSKDFYKKASDNSDKQSVFFYIKDSKLKDYYDRGSDTNKYYYDNSEASFKTNAAAPYQKVEMQTEYQASDTDYESYLDTINIYYDPNLKEELLADNAVEIVANFAVSMLKAELTWTVDSNYDFSNVSNYWNLGDITETGRIESTYVGAYNIYAQGTKQIQIKTTTVDDRSANSIKLRVSARLTDDSDPANTYYDEFKVFSINLLPAEKFYFGGDNNA